MDNRTFYIDLQGKEVIQNWKSKKS
jgi:hypothetical protein